MSFPFTLTLLLLTLFIPTLLWADDQLSSIPVPAPRITESTLIQGTGWSAGGNRNESIACDLAEHRAIQQVKKGIAVARAKRMITSEELSHARPLTRFRNWDRVEGWCTIRMELEIPSIPKSSGIPIIHERQF